MNPKLTPEQKVWKREYISCLRIHGLSKRLAEENFNAGFFDENNQCTVDLTDDPKGSAMDELSYMASDG